MKFTATMNKTDIELAIKSIAGRGAKLDNDIQLTALSCIAHYADHRDNTLINRLWLAMPKGSRRSALTEWLVQFGGVDVNMNKETAKEQPFVTPAKDARRPVDIAGGTAKPWYECKKEKEPSEEFDFNAMLATLLKKAEAASASGKVIVGADALAAVRKAVAGAAASDK